MKDYENLPKLPEPDFGYTDFEGDWVPKNAYTPKAMRDYALQAINEYLKRQ